MTLNVALLLTVTASLPAPPGKPLLPLAPAREVVLVPSPSCRVPALTMVPPV